MKIINFLNKNIIIPISDQLRGTDIGLCWSNINTMSSWTSAEIRDWQTENLKKLISQVYHHTIYYKEMFNKYGLRPSDFTDISDLKKLPVLTKKDIINNAEKLIPDNLHDIRYKNVATGGSTGVPLKYRIDMKSFSYSTAMRYYYWEKIGFKYGNKLAVIGGTSIIPDHKDTVLHKFYHIMNRKSFLNGVNMSDQVCDQYLELICRKKIAYIYGYPSAI